MFDLTKTKRWKFILMIGAILISVFFLLFTNYLVRELSKRELAEVHKLVKAFEQLNNPAIEDFTEIKSTIENATIPIIVVDEKENILLQRNLDSTKINDTSYIRSQLFWMEFYNDPIPIKYAEDQYHYINYKEQPAITLLRYFPYVQLLLLGIFLTVSYFAFNTNRLYEQNKLWVGMAKETAHQIGTPLSSLIAWIEYLRNLKEPPSNDVLAELEKDVKRLEVITQRFSKIGSTPDLENTNVADVVNDTVSYLRSRLSNKTWVHVEDHTNGKAFSDLNKNLFSWVIENIVKNAVDAMSGVGDIHILMAVQKHHVLIDIKDSGKGIPRNNFNVIFEPGYTTKKRGWGLGLSLAKRIIHDYHKGEIFVKDSEAGKGTTFRIKLKRSNSIT